MSKAWPILLSQIDLSSLWIFPDRTVVSIISNLIFFAVIIIPISWAYATWLVPVSE